MAPADVRATDKQFLSTLPARGATDYAGEFAFRQVISIHAPREGSDQTNRKSAPAKEDISIHAPREGSDAREPLDKRGMDISIHAPREGSDIFGPNSWICRI